MVDVAISDADRSRADSHYGLFGKYPGTLATGSEWAKLFVGKPNVAPIFAIDSAKVDDETIAATFATRVHYRIKGTLTYKGRDYEINAGAPDHLAFYYSRQRMRPFSLELLTPPTKSSSL
jgi:hypothetical protein